MQFLANRGYAVLQMNFRGSTGYGKAFWQASFKQWGRTMQDDITDGVQWLDRARGSPTRRGSPSTAPPTAATPPSPGSPSPRISTPAAWTTSASRTCFTFMNTFPPYWELGRKMIYEMVGDPEKDKELMTAASPVFHADKIKAPLLVAQGANDPRVNKAESDQIVEALQGARDRRSLHGQGERGARVLLEENRFDFYRAMERFLGKHLGGRVEAAAGE